MPIVPLEVIGFAPETTFGTFVTPTLFVPGTADPATNTKVVTPAQSRGTRGQVIDAIVGIDAGVTVRGELIPEVFSGLEAAWYGVGSDARTGSAGTGFTHALTPKNVLPSLSVEIDHDISAQVLARQFVGCNVDQITFRATNQTLATIEAVLVAQRETTPATPGAPSNANPTTSALQPMDFSLLAATYKGSATSQLMDITLGLSNQVQRVYSNNGKLYAARLVPTRRQVTFQTSLDFLDTVFYTDWIQGTKTTGMVLTMTGSQIPSASGSFVVEHTLPALRAQGQFGLASANDVLSQNVTWSATVGAGGNEVSSRWVNSEPGILA